MKQLVLIRMLAAAMAVLVGTRAASANTASWIGNPGVTATTNWSDLANWSNTAGGVAGAFQNDVKFAATGTVGTAGTVTSVVDVGQRPLSIAYANVTGAFHTTLIPASVTLTNDNAFTVSGGTADGRLTVVNLTGAGTLVQNGSGMLVENFGSTVSTALATLDMSGLSNFIYNNSIGAITVGGTSGNRSAGSLTLAATSNYITISSLNMGTGSGLNAGTSFLNFGAGTNILNAATILIATNKNTATVGFSGATGGLRIRGVSGADTDRANISVGIRNTTGTGITTGTLALNGHPVDIKFGTLNLGNNSVTANGLDQATGILQFDTGIVDVTTILMAADANPNGTNNATITVGSAGTLILGSGGLSIASQPPTSTGFATGNINIFGGSLIANGNIFKGQGNVRTTGTITMMGGSLSLAPLKTIGTPALPLDNLSLSNSVLNLTLVNNSTNLVVKTLFIDGQSTTTNIINIVEVGPVAVPVVELPVIKYTTLSFSNDVNFNVALGSLPDGYAGYITNDTTGNFIGVVLTATAPPQPVFTSQSLQPGPLLVINGTNGFANFPYSVLSSPDITVPLSSWPIVTTNVFNPDGTFSFTNSFIPATPQQFYQLKVGP